MVGTPLQWVAQSGVRQERPERLSAPLAALVIAGLSGALWAGLWQVATILF